MAAPGGGPFIGGRQVTPQEMEARMTEEAKKHGLTLEQFKQLQMIQQKRLEAEAAKAGMTPQQFIAMQQQRLQEEAAKAGMSPQQFLAMKQQEAIQAQRQAAQQAQQQGQQSQSPDANGQPPQPQPGQPQLQKIDLNKPVEPKPDALAVAKFLRSQDLKLRTCIFDGQRKEMFKVKRAFRVLQSDAYKKAREKDPLLPPVTNDVEARNAVQLLPLNMLALRVGKKDDEHAGHNHKKPKRVKGLWDVKIEGQQEFEPMMHYMWIYEVPSIKTRVYSILALLAVFTVVLFPLWPMFMRQGVWYLSVGAMGLLGAFFAMAIFRLILFCVTVFAVPPGLWLFPNLFEDVGFFDSFKPVWGWQETKKKKKSKKGGDGSAIAAGQQAVEKASQDVPTSNMNGGAIASGSEPTASTGGALTTKRHAAPMVEDADDD
ncbi:Translocation protein S62 [Lithohypha guttulata]|uniref:Translocation protein SEC62 n=1 Tax=Lithohypha guttulata TaxID=1690604 RepID=A0AAN7T3G1_9EURO|nr:Translocation protein S62 [Lithohypha guttulata]